jgi:hypothetical protein
MRGCEFDPQLLIAGGVHVAEAGGRGPATSAIGASSFSASVTYQSRQF